MTEDKGIPSKTFTVDQANAMLPLVRAITRDLVSLSSNVVDQRRALSQLLAGREMDSDNPYHSELEEVQRQLDQDKARLQEYVVELKQLGIVPKDGLEGLVDFPALMNGRLVYLCWKLGEPEITHWHEIDSNYSGRQSLIANVGPANDETLGQSDTAEF